MIRQLLPYMDIELVDLEELESVELASF